MSDIGPGDLVECVDTSAWRSDAISCRPPRMIRRGCFYTVAGVVPSLSGGAVILRGVDSEHDTTSGGYGFWRFRKLDEGDSARLIERLGVDLKEPTRIKETAQ